jgi:hypothetical protein
MLSDRLSSLINASGLVSGPGIPGAVGHPGTDYPERCEEVRKTRLIRVVAVSLAVFMTSLSFGNLIARFLFTVIL